MGGGDFIQGLTGGIQNAMQMRQQSVDNQMRADYMKTQKKLMDMQWKAAEMEEQWWNQQPANIRGLKFMPKEAQTIGMLMSGIMPLPGMAPAGGGGGAGALPSPMPAPETAGAQPEGGPTSGGVVDIVAQARTNPLLGGLLKKFMGANPGEIAYRSGIADPVTGKAQTVGLDVSGKQIPGISLPEAADIITEEMNIGNQPFYRDIDKYTRQQVGELRPKQQGVKPLGTTEANTIALTKSSLRDAQRGIDTLFSNDKKSITGKLVGSMLNIPGTSGREFSQAWDRASKPLMVALTGTGMSEKEAEKILNMSKPQPGDKETAIKAKIESLVGFMEERLKLMDPTGDYGLVNINLPWKNRPDLNLGKKKAGRKPLTAFEGQ